MSESLGNCGCGAPVLVVCGFSGSGKTTLLEAAIQQLVKRGLAVAIVKHDAHGFEVDKQGKDSDRFFRAGATVELRGPVEQVERRQISAGLSLESTLARLGQDHDLVLVEGHKDTPLPKIWLRAEAEAAAPESVKHIVMELAWGEERYAKFMEYVDAWLPKAWSARPLYRGMLMGGMSSRMGTPKQMLRFGDRMMGEIVMDALGGETAGVLALGLGPLPASLSSTRRLLDAPEYQGPGAALIAAHRWAPHAAWVVSACDHPWLRREHVEWLMAQRRPGTWAVIPRQSDGHPCPMLALYEPQALEYLERTSRVDAERNARVSMLLDAPRTLIVQPPAEFLDAWKNVNTREEFEKEEKKLEIRR